MPEDKDAKRAIVEQFARRPGDTGSVEVQVALLTQRIDALTEHLRTRAKDIATRRGLVRLVGRRNDLLAYLRRTDSDRYAALVDRLGLRG